jgi:hypothetical protein
MRPVRAERFLDDLARILAEPTSRRGAVRRIGTLLAAIALPRVAPRRAFAAETKGVLEPCAPGAARCQQLDEDRKTNHDYCCPYPQQQWQCGSKDNGYTCTNTCPPSIVLNGVTYKQEATWSRETYEGGQPKRYDCCVIPNTEPRDGECVPACASLMGPGAFRCKDTCCPKDARWGGDEFRPSATFCQAGTCVGKCSAGYVACGSLWHTCCATNWKCCNLGLCCGPTESCCGSECCPKGKFCCDGGGNVTQCCNDDEYCLYEAPPGMTRGGAIGLPRATRCSPSCDPVNRCGDQCCGSGFICARSGPKQGKCILNLKRGP